MFVALQNCQASFEAFVLHWCSMVSARRALPASAKEGCMDVWPRTLATWNSKMSGVHR